MLEYDKTRWKPSPLHNQLFDLELASSYKHSELKVVFFMTCIF